MAPLVHARDPLAVPMKPKVQTRELQDEPEDRLGGQLVT